MSTKNSLRHRHRAREIVILSSTLAFLTARRVHGFHPLMLRPQGLSNAASPINRTPTGGNLRKRLLASSNRNAQLSRDPSSLLQLQAVDDEPCLAGSNAVKACDVPPESITPLGLSSSRGTQTTLSAATNIGKCICGAGSFALPHVFLKEGVLGGTLAMGICAILATWTMQSLNDSRYSPALVLVEERKDDSNDFNEIENDDEIVAGNKLKQNNFPPTSYVSLAELALGKPSSALVFALTLAASLGVCSTYIAFIGQTLSSLSSDAASNNFVHRLAPNLPQTTWEFLTALSVLPLSLVRNYGIFAFTSALGVTAVLGGILVTLTYGILVDPGMGLSQTLSSVSHLPLWPDSVGDAFGGSFGTIAYLFCVNFLTFPIITSMENPEKDYNTSVAMAVSGVWLVNVLFAIICLAFYGTETQDLVLQNLENGVYLVLLKVLLCVDLLFTFPVVFSSGRQILENAILGKYVAGSESGIATSQKEQGDKTSWTLALSRGAITTTAVGTCYGLSQIGGFGVVANLIGGVAQGTLAFIVPPAIAIALKRRENNGRLDVANELPQWLIAIFGGAVVSSVTYFTFCEAMN